MNDFEMKEGPQVNKEKKKIFQNIRNYFREYCVCSSIHGFRYFGEKRTYFERFWWFIVFVTCMAGCGYLIREVYRKWERSPVIVSFATRETPIYDIPFPAVTICPESKFIKAKYDHTDMLIKYHERNLTQNEETQLDYASVICTADPDRFNYNPENFTMDFFTNLKNISLMNFVDPTLRFMGKRLKSQTMFKPIVTDEGVCFTLNTLDRSELYRDEVVQYSDFHKMGQMSYQNWSMDQGYHPQAGLNTYPRRALLSGANNALIVTLSIAKDNLDFTCKNSFQGYRVILHTPMRIPRASQDYFLVPFNQVVSAEIQPTMITTSESVKLYNPKRRDCYFPNEFKLRFFKVYTNLNCRLECLTNYTLHMCGCVNFFMPRDNKTELCGSANIACMKDAEYRLQMGHLYNNLAKKSVKNKTRKYGGKAPSCKCMPICSDLTYNVETSQSNWDWTQSVFDDNYNYYLQDNGTDLGYYRSKLVIYFKSSQFVTSQRHELYGPTDFLANFGGLLGLFTGFSVLSLMEIIYFLTVRLCCNVRLFGYWAGPK